MDAQLKKGMLDACVLAAIARGDAYGYKVTRETVDILHIAESSLYPVLRRLEKQGYFENYSVEQNGRLRKYYKMTELGWQKFQDLQQELSELKGVIEFVMKPANDITVVDREGSHE